MMMQLNVEDVLFIKADEQTLSSIFVLLKERIDVLDYRIPFCHVFLRQSEIFFQYQENCNQLNHIQQYLKGLLDQLPIGLIIVNDQSNVSFMNHYFEELLNIDFLKVKDKNYNVINLPTALVDNITKAVSINADVIHQTDLKLNNKESLTLLFSFIINDSVTVLTSIQQSKDLFDQMNPLIA